MKRTEEIRERLNKATQGEWISDEYGEFISQKDNTSFHIAQTRGWGYLTGKGGGGLGLSDDEAIEIQTANANFIAHAPQDIRYLLEQLEKYKKAEEQGLLVKLSANINSGAR